MIEDVVAVLKAEGGDDSKNADGHANSVVRMLIVQTRMVL